MALIEAFQALDTSLDAFWARVPPSEVEAVQEVEGRRKGRWSFELTNLEEQVNDLLDRYLYTEDADIIAANSFQSCLPSKPVLERWIAAVAHRLPDEVVTVVQADVQGAILPLLVYCCDTVYMSELFYRMKSLVTCAPTLEAVRDQLGPYAGLARKLVDSAHTIRRAIISNGPAHLRMRSFLEEHLGYPVLEQLAARGLWVALGMELQGFHHCNFASFSMSVSGAATVLELYWYTSIRAPGERQPEIQSADDQALSRPASSENTNDQAPSSPVSSEDGSAHHVPLFLLAHPDEVLTKGLVTLPFYHENGFDNGAAEVELEVILPPFARFEPISGVSWPLQLHDLVSRKVVTVVAKAWGTTTGAARRLLSKVVADVDSECLCGSSARFIILANIGCTWAYGAPKTSVGTAASKSQKRMRSKGPAQDRAARGDSNAASTRRNSRRKRRRMRSKGSAQDMFVPMKPVGTPGALPGENPGELYRSAGA